MLLIEERKGRNDTIIMYNYNVISKYLTKNTYIQGFKEFQAAEGNNFLCTWLLSKYHISIGNHGVSTSRKPPAMNESM